jgi:uncharacterized phage protein gp47/JayE
MAFNRPTLQQIAERILSDFQSRITGAGSLLRRSFIRVVAKVYAGAIHLLYGFLTYIKDQIFATTADTNNLDAHGNEVGVIRTEAVKATGQGTATGTNGIAIPANTELQSGEGLIYIVDTAVTIAGGIATLDLTAQLAGNDGNEDGGVELTFISPIANVNTIVTITTDGITGGIDEETDDDYRDRILARKRTPPHGGTEFDYENWTKEVSGVTRVWITSAYQGAGTVGVAFVRDNDTDSIIPSESEIATVRSYLISHTDPITGETTGIPVTAEPGLFMITVSLYTVDFTIKIYPNTTTVQNSVTTRLEEFINAEGGPGQTLYYSRISEVISSAASEERHEIVTPVGDVTASTTQVHVLGTITWQDY